MIGNGSAARKPDKGGYCLAGHKAPGERLNLHLPEPFIGALCGRSPRPPRSWLYSLFSVSSSSVVKKAG